jgi:hypothetical protein
MSDSFVVAEIIVASMIEGRYRDGKMVGIPYIIGIQKSDIGCVSAYIPKAGIARF